MSKEILTTQWDGYLREGPGAVTTAIPVPVHPNGHAGDPLLEPEYKRMPIGPDHILYPVLIGLAAFPILMGRQGHHVAEDMPEDKTHPFFPDHFWPYPIIMVLLLVTVGLMAAFVQQNMQLEQPADPRAVVLPRPDWYFLWLFQMLKLGNEFFFTFIVPPGIIIGLLLWPFIDGAIGRRIASRLRWANWPVPGRNVITGTAWILFLGFVVMLTFWALSGVTIFNITGG